MGQSNPYLFILFLKRILDIPKSVATTGRRLAIPDYIPHLFRSHSAKVEDALSRIWVYSEPPTRRIY